MKSESQTSLAHNVVSHENKTKVVNATSFMKGCVPTNVISEDETKLWMSEPGLPQAIVLDFGNISKQKNNQFVKFGFKCSSAYASNPSKIAINTSSDGKHF
jgi:hypothetical protein